MAYSNSYLTTFQRCPRQCQLKYAGIRQRFATDHDLRYGAAVHDALAEFYKGERIEQVVDTFLKAYPIQLNVADNAKTRPNGVTMLEAYCEAYQEDLNDWEVLEVEQYARGEDDFAVKLDLVVRQGDEIYGVDHKVTKSYLDYKWWGKFNPNSQISEYVKYIIERYGECAGFIINGISMKYRSRAYKGEAAGYWHRFERQVMQRRDFQLEQDLRSRQAWVARIEECKEAAYWPTNTEECWHCEYKPICEKGYTLEDDFDLITTEEFMQVCGQRIMAGEVFTGEYCNLELPHEEEHRLELLPQDTLTIDGVGEVAFD